MIEGFAHAGLELFFKTGSRKGIQPHHAARLSAQLFALDSASRPQDMSGRGWGLHPLKGDMDGYWAITVNANWRLIFRFKDGDAYVVDYRDYH